MEASNIAPTLLEFVPLGTHLIRGGIEDPIHQGVVEGCRHADRFWEDGDIAHIGYAMQCLTPPLESLDAQARDGRRIVEHQGCFLIQGETTTQVNGSLMR